MTPTKTTDTTERGLFARCCSNNSRTTARRPNPINYPRQSGIVTRGADYRVVGLDGQWAVDFDFECKPQIVQIEGGKIGRIEGVWAGDYVFENEWQLF